MAYSEEMKRFIKRKQKGYDLWLSHQKGKKKKGIITGKIGYDVVDELGKKYGNSISEDTHKGTDFPFTKIDKEI